MVVGIRRLRIMKGVKLMDFGYARVSTKQQDETRQVEAIKRYVDDDRNIIIDKQSGKDFNRNGYNSLIGTDNVAPQLRSGDTLYITDIDRLGRSYIEIKEQWAKLKSMGVRIVVLNYPTLVNNSRNELINELITNIIFEMLCYQAEQERITMLKRQRDGINNMPIIDGKRVSRKTGRPAGRPVYKLPDNWDEVIQRWKNGEISAVAAQNELNMKHSTFYKNVKNKKLNKS